MIAPLDSFVSLAQESQEKIYTCVCTIKPMSERIGRSYVIRLKSTGFILELI